MSYGGVAAYALMEAGVLSLGTSHSREGLVNGLAAFGGLRAVRERGGLVRRFRR